VESNIVSFSSFSIYFVCVYDPVKLFHRNHNTD